VVNREDPAEAPVAVVDLGSNTVLLLVLDRAGGVLCDESRTTRLGQGVFASGRLGAEAIARTVEVVEGFAARARELGAVRVLAVGTAALRRAANAADLVDRLCDLGVTVRILPGPVEAALAIEASRRAAGPNAREVVVIDVGGGSTEVAWTDPAGEVRGISLPLGSVRLTEELVTAHPVPGAMLARIRERVAGEVRALAAERERGLPLAGRVVAVAGTATTLVALELRLEPYDAKRVEGTRLSRAVLRDWTERLAALDVTARRALPGMEPGRADVIVAGLVVLDGVLEALGATHFGVSGRGVRHGVALRLLDGSGELW
jgi:exopolyphosphatase/guanosine-5'-triphosphate,3'-diphosphate pyrophosphatase